MSSSTLQKTPLPTPAMPRDAMAAMRTIGWREWVMLPELPLRALKAKIDSGAKTCALHADCIELFSRDNATWVRFGIYTSRRAAPIACEALLLDRREVRDSGGHSEQRCVIATTMLIGDMRFNTELTLTDRTDLQYRMLIGRNALRDRFVVDCAHSFILGRPVSNPT